MSLTRNDRWIGEISWTNRRQIPNETRGRRERDDFGIQECGVEVINDYCSSHR